MSVESPSNSAMVKVADMALCFACCAAVATLGCRRSSAGLSAPTIGELATNIVRLAEAERTPLDSVMAESERTKLLEMIRRSGMLTNYPARLQESRNKARLDYHERTLKLHFQIDLEKDGQTWIVKRIWLCR
jgi:hypothetical protein